MDGFLKVRKTRGFAKFDNITGEAAANAISVLPEDTLEATTFDPEEGKRLGLVKDAAVAVVAIGGRACSFPVIHASMLTLSFLCSW